MARFRIYHIIRYVLKISRIFIAIDKNLSSHPGTREQYGVLNIPLTFVAALWHGLHPFQPRLTLRSVAYRCRVLSRWGRGGGVGGRECNRSARSRGVYRALGLASRSAKLEEVRLARVPRECARFSRRIA